MTDHSDTMVGTAVSAVSPIDLVAERNGRPMADSRDVADRFGRQHRNVLRDIRDLHCSPEFRALNFEQTAERAKVGAATRDVPFVRMTRDGFAFLVFGWTGIEAGQTKEAWLAQFNAMEDVLRRRQSVSFADFEEFAAALRNSVALATQSLQMSFVGRLPELIDAAIASHPRVAVREYRSVKEALDMAGAIKKGRNGINRKIGYRLREQALLYGVGARHCDRTGTWMFPIAFLDSYMKAEGNRLVAEHNDAVIGQHVLPFASKRRRAKLSVVPAAFA